MLWESLGFRNAGGGGWTPRAWLQGARRRSTGRLYVCGGSTLPDRNAVVMFDPASETWVLEKDDMPGPQWPDAGAVSPAISDNGTAFWDNINDEMWTTTVNYKAQICPAAIYRPRGGSWRVVTDAEFPGYGLDLNFKINFNMAAASNARYAVGYGGGENGVHVAHLRVLDGQAKTWTFFPNHGVAGPGPGKSLENLLQWADTLGAFVLFKDGVFWRLTGPSWAWSAQLYTGDVIGAVDCLAVLPARGALVLGSGATQDLWLVDLATWQSTRVPGTGLSASVLPRHDGVMWAEGDRVYLEFGYLPNGPDSNTNQTLFRATLPPLGSPMIPVISGVQVALV